MPSPSTSSDLAAIKQGISDFLSLKDNQGRIISNAKHGVYAFYDYDGEPIYVGQTAERLRARIGRHLTNQRTDAVAMNVLDPAEVAEIEVWPMFELKSDPEAAEKLNRAEYTVFQSVLKRSVLGAVLNEKDIPPTEFISLPVPTRGRIVPDDIYQRLKHPVKVASPPRCQPLLPPLIAARFLGCRH